MSFTLNIENHNIITSNESKNLKDKDQIFNETNQVPQQSNEMPLTNRVYGTRKRPVLDNISLGNNLSQVKVQMDNSVIEPIISTTSDHIFTSTDFKDLPIDKRITGILKLPKSEGGLGFINATSVQAKAIPLISEGNDIIIKSETGSGKTLAFMIPIVQKLCSMVPRVSRSDGTRVLILAPTRELCMQILETATTLLKPFHYIVASCVVGGEKRKSEKARLRKGVSVLIATPGRLYDHIEHTHSFKIENLSFLVLDEADRLLDMGFEQQIALILKVIDSRQLDRSDRQTLLVSATINKGIERIANISLKNPTFIDADSLEAVKHESLTKDTITSEYQEKFCTPHQLAQHFMIVSAKQRLPTLCCFIRSEIKARGQGKFLIFFSTCDSVDFHYEMFLHTSWPHMKSTSHIKNLVSLFGHDCALYKLHGNIDQKSRLDTFHKFSKSMCGVMLCTDVAARGLNLSTVEWIIQYDPPTETRDYVHRIGRTARSGNKGSSLLFLMPSEVGYLDHLKKFELSPTALSAEKTILRSSRKGEFMISKKKPMHEVIMGELQFLFEQYVLGNTDLFEVSCQAFHSFIRSYATHSADTKNIFCVRGLHFGHIAKSFGLREPPASSRVRKSGVNAKKGTLENKRRRERLIEGSMLKKKRRRQRHYENSLSIT